ncbi:MAG: sulfatase-like hydrolase/transferase [Gemmatimonadetes bacterium]|nr:sulfatase-like hydrolase/transferase [Gemmatimonadota bacterium]
MPRSVISFGLVALVALGCAPAAPPVAEQRPNIVFVLVDDLRWDDIAVAGHPFAETPNIDRLASEGARFLNAFASTPLCSPSRASILTGQYVRTNGIVDNTARDSASHRLATFAIPLQARDIAPGSSASGTWATTTRRVRGGRTGSRCAGRARRWTLRSTSMAPVG